MIRNWYSSVMLSTILATAFCVQARAAAAEPPAPEVYPLELSATDDLPNGEATSLQSTADSVGQRYALGGTELDQPILVSVLTQDPSDNVRVRIVKDDWNAPDRDQATTGAKRLDFAFHTFDGFRVWVTADKPTDYQLIVWVGAPMASEPPPIAEPASTFVEGQRSHDPKASDSQRAASSVAADGNEGTAGRRADGVSFSRLELMLGAVIGLMLLGLVVFLLVRRGKPSNGVSP